VAKQVVFFAFKQTVILKFEQTIIVTLFETPRKYSTFEGLSLYILTWSQLSLVKIQDLRFLCSDSGI
jgi:hypothetical protein